MALPCGSVGYGSSVVTAAAQAAIVVWVPFLAHELPHASGTAQKRKKKKKKKKKKKTPHQKKKKAKQEVEKILKETMI